MELQYLGTAAAEAFPGIFCACDTCRRAKRAGGKNLRTRSQSVLDGSLLIDFPCDTVYHMYQHGLPTESIFHCIVTHAHEDHFYPEELINRRPGMSVAQEGTVFHLYGTEKVFQKTREIIEAYGLQSFVAAHPVKPYEPFQVLHYTVTPLPANHDPKAAPVIYSITDGTSALLYAHDTGILKEEVWQWLAAQNRPYDYVSLDCTAGLKKNWRDGHLGLDTCIEFRERLAAVGAVVAGKTKCCLNHFSHNCLADYDEMLAEGQKFGFDVSYDGKKVSF